jgi:ribonuclease E
VLNQAEALVAIDVNSGRATREHHIEDTALKTNLEASDEIARQLRLRDLAGLIVIDFIDMDESRNNRAVERRLKECLKQDRARIQVGRISHFGLLEMSRQRIRTSVLESSTDKCPYCGGSGHVRSVSSLALQLLRGLEEQLIKGATHNLVVRTRGEVAFYVLNHKRSHLRALEERFRITITINADDTVAAPQSFAIERGEQVHTPEAAKALAEQTEVVAAPLEEEDDLEEPVEAAEASEAVAEARPADHDRGERGEGDGRRRRRRRRRGHRNGGFNGERAEHTGHPAELAADAAEGEGRDLEPEHAEGPQGAPESFADNGHEGDRKRRRRGRRGGRRSRREREGGGADAPGEAREFGDEPSFAPDAPEQSSSGRSDEPELREAVADLDRAPIAAEPMPAPAAVAEQPTAAEDAPRRRSTVREPAPIGDGEAAPPIPLPRPQPEPAAVVVESNDAENAGRQRRTGWWSRRITGE